MPTYIHELQYPLYLIAGTSLKRGFVFKDGDEMPLNLTGYSAEVDIRKRVGDKDAIFKLTSEGETEKGSKLEITPEEGRIDIRLTPEESEDFTLINKDQHLVWDIRVTDPYGDAVVYFRGSPFVVKPVSTRGETE